MIPGSMMKNNSHNVFISQLVYNKLNSETAQLNTYLTKE